MTPDVNNGKMIAISFTEHLNDFSYKIKFITLSYFVLSLLAVATTTKTKTERHYASREDEFTYYRQGFHC